MNMTYIVQKASDVSLMLRKLDVRRLIFLSAVYLNVGRVIASFDNNNNILYNISSATFPSGRL